jgi:hypothetical protein
MKIRSLLLGSAALAGLSTAGYAADLGVVTSLDVCDELGLSGLTISSDDNCLQISGNVTFEYDFGDYKIGGASHADHVYGRFSNANNGNTYNVIDGDGTLDSNRGDVDAWLKFVGTADSDFGPASATIKLISENNTGTSDWSVGIDQAFVTIGDTTQIMAGYKDSIFNKGDDEPLNYLGLFNSESVNTGVLWGASDPNDPVAPAGDGDNDDADEHAPLTGGDVIQVKTDLGNGFAIAGGIENLGGEDFGYYTANPDPTLPDVFHSTSQGKLTGVGTLYYAGDDVTAHVSGAVDTVGAWKTHAGFTGSWDPIKVVGAVAADSTGYYDALGSIQLGLDMFKLSASAEAAEDGWGAGGSIGADVTDGVTLNLGGRYWEHTAGANYDVYQVEGGVSAKVTDTLTLTAAVGVTDSTQSADDTMAIYGKAGLAWAPGGGFTSSLNGTVTSLGGYKAVFKASKDIK